MLKPTKDTVHCFCCFFVSLRHISTYKTSSSGQARACQQMQKTSGAPPEEDVLYVEICRSEMKKQQKQCTVSLVGFNVTISFTTMHGVRSGKLMFFAFISQFLGYSGFSCCIPRTLLFTIPSESYHFLQK
jgi:hypothetical protein